MTTPIPGAYDPTARLRDLYRAAETRLLNDLRIQQATRRVLGQLTPHVMAEIDAILDTAVLDGEQRAKADG